MKPASSLTAWAFLDSYCFWECCLGQLRRAGVSPVEHQVSQGQLRVPSQCHITCVRWFTPDIPVTWEVEEGSGVQVILWLSSEFETSLGYMRLCLQKKKSPVL